MHLIIVQNPEEISQLVSKTISSLVVKKPNAVLGLATGSSPIGTYNLLIKDYQNNKTDWSKVVTFNLDEYVGLDAHDPTSYHYFMNHHLFNHININKENIHIPSGIGNITENIKNYENLLENFGPVDLQLLGIGENGHIGFNEPGSTMDSKTRVVNLTASTITANKHFFDHESQVPTQAITMGIATILKANTIVLIASGSKKAPAIKALIHGKVDAQWPCSYLQNHENVIIIIDQEAAKLLEQPKTERKN